MCFQKLFELFESCAKTESHTTGITHEFSELRQKKCRRTNAWRKSMTIWLTQSMGRNKSTSQKPTLAASFVSMVTTSSPTTNAIKTPPACIHFNRESSDLEEHVKQFFA